MTTLDTLFATTIYRTRLGGRGGESLRRELAQSCRVIAEEDMAGRRWSRDNGYQGYTSYSSLDDLPWRSPSFAALVERIDGHVAAFSKALELDLKGRPLVLDNIWINLLQKGGAHTGHIHPNCVVSGTFYVEVPSGAGGLRFEDPRLARMMAAPPRKLKARGANRPFVEVAPVPGMLMLWESWLRHEVMPNRAGKPRISISFNYRWG